MSALFSDISLAAQSLVFYKYAALFPGAVLEGPILTVVAGLFAATGALNLFIATPIIIAGDMLGDFLHYAAGKWGRDSFVHRFARYLGVEESHLTDMKTQFTEHPVRTYAVGKAAHGAGGLVLVAAGLVDAPLGSFLLYNFLFTIPKTFILLAIGYVFGSTLSTIEGYLGVVGAITSSIAFIALVAFIVYRKWKR